MNERLIDEAISLLHSQHHEDLAMEIQNLRDALILTRGHLAAQRSLAGKLALELAQIEDDPRRLEDSDDELEIERGEDCALKIEKLQSELERVKRIAGDRLDTIQNLRHDVAVLEDKLEDTRSDVRAIEEATAQVRRWAANALLR